ncbi:MAG TPA: hypothetical protein VMV51_02730 [Gemmatimonadaceae bacterium]|nr:hypothetical protein [Gemmatimonadaceae bacterium]
MTAAAPFTTQLRARRDTIRLGGAGEPTVTIRVEMPAVWDTVRLQTPSTEMVETVKKRALEALFPQAQYHEDFVIKLNGWEILNERESLADAGVQNGAILLLMHRRRRTLR